MHSLYKFLGVAGAGAALFAALFPWSFSNETFRREIARQASAMTGLRVELSGRADFAALPRPRVKIEGLRAVDPAGALTVEADYLRGDVRILPLFGGRLELANVALVAPKLDIDLARIRPSVATLGGAPPSAPAAPTTPVAISIANGEAIVHAGDAWRTRIEDIAMSLDWLGLARPLTLRADMRWRGEAARLQFWTDAPTSVGTTRAEPLVVKFEAPSFAASVDGSLGGDAHPEFRGAVTASVASLRDLLAGFNGPRQSDAGEMRLAMTATTRIGADGVNLSDARIDVADMRFDGALAIIADAPQPLASGTFATNNLDLAGFIDAPVLSESDNPARIAAASWSDILHAVDLDLRLSAARLRLGRVEATGAGFTVISRDGRLEASLTDAHAYDGEIHGQMTGGPANGIYTWQAEGFLDHVDLGALSASAHRPLGLTGTADGEIAIDSAGIDQARVLANLHGGATLAVHGGEFVGIDLEQALRRIERRPLSTAADLRGGRTRFDLANVAILMDHGVATIDNLTATGPAVAFSITGSANLPARDFNLNLLAWPTADRDDDGDAQPRLAIGIRGPFVAPNLFLDPQTLIERSRAAAPLWSGEAQSPNTAPLAARQSP